MSAAENNDVERPEFARGSYTQAQWESLSPERRQGLIEANIRQTSPALALDLLRQARAMGEIALSNYAQYNDAERDAALRMAEIEGQRQLVSMMEMSAEERERRGTSFQVQVEELQRAVARLAEERRRLAATKSSGLGVGLTVAIAVASVAAVGALVYFAARSAPAPRKNPRTKRFR